MLASPSSRTAPCRREPRLKRATFSKCEPSLLLLFRNFSKSKVGTVVLGLFLVTIFASFALTDISSFGGGGLTSGSLVKAGDEQVSDRDFSTAMERLLANARQQNPEATYATVGTNAPALIEQLTDDAAIKAFARTTICSSASCRADIATAETRGLSEIHPGALLLPAPATDRCDRAAPVQGYLRAADARRRRANPRIPVGVATPYASMLLEQRQGELVLVQTAAFRAGLTPTAGDLQTYYEQNKQRYMVPEQRVLRIASIGPEQVANLVPSEAEIAANYKGNSALYAGRETRVISQAVVPTKAAADAIVARTRAGATFVAALSCGLAAEYSGRAADTQRSPLAGNVPMPFVPRQARRRPDPFRPWLGFVRSTCGNEAGVPWRCGGEIIRSYDRQRKAALLGPRQQSTSDRGWASLRRCPGQWPGIGRTRGHGAASTAPTPLSFPAARHSSSGACSARTRSGSSLPMGWLLWWDRTHR